MDAPVGTGPCERRFRPWFVVSLCTLAAMAVAACGIAPAALRVFSVEATTPIDWVPSRFPPRRDYEAFVREFESGDVVIASWPGCELGAPALERIVEAATGPGSPRDREGRPWFEGVATGSTVLTRLVDPPLALDRDEAIDRLVGVIVGPDRRTTLAAFGFTPAGLADRRRAVDWIRATIRRTATVDDAAVHLAGPVVDTVTVDIASTESFNTFAAPAGVIILLLTWWSLGSFGYACLVFLVSLWCVGLSFATIEIWGDRMNPVLIVMPVLVLALGVSGGIHLVNYLVESSHRGGRDGMAARAIRLGWLPCLLSAGTTAIGLASLVVSELEPIRTFGFHASMAVMATLACLFLVVPGIFERWPIAERRAGRPSAGAAVEAARAGSQPAAGAVAPWFAAGVIRHATVIVAAFLAAMAVAGAGITGIRTSVRIDTLFSTTSRVIGDYRWIEEHIGPLVPIEVVLAFAADSPVAPAERLSILERCADRLRRTAESQTVLSAALFMPEPTVSSGPLAFARRGVAARRLERNLIALDDMKYIRSDGAGGQLWRATGRISALRDVDYGAVLDRVRADVAALVGEVGGASRGIASSCTGVMPLVHAIQNVLLGDLFWSFLSACGLITLVMMVVERGVLAGLVAMVSNVFPMILLFGAIGWMGVPLDIGSVMTASIALGMAIDGTLHFLSFFRRGIDAGLTPPEAVHAAFDHCAAAMTQSTVVCAVGILVFSASSFAPTSRFAWMLALLMLAALAGDLVLLPAMLVGPLGRWFERRAVPRASAADVGGGSGS